MRWFLPETDAGCSKSTNDALGGSEIDEWGRWV